MSAAVVRSGVMRQIGVKAGQVRALTSDDVQDPDKLTRELAEIRKTQAEHQARPNPRRIDFMNVVVDGTAATKYRFTHRFGGQIVWWPVGWRSASASGFATLDEHADTDDNTLVLISYIDGTVSIRIEEAG